MNSFGKYLRNRREELVLPLRTVAGELDIDTSILSKIKRCVQVATKEIQLTLTKTLEVQKIEIEFIKAFILTDIGDFIFLKTAKKKRLTVLKAAINYEYKQ